MISFKTSSHTALNLGEDLNSSAVSALFVNDSDFGGKRKSSPALATRPASFASHQSLQSGDVKRSCSRRRTLATACDEANSARSDHSFMLENALLTAFKSEYSYEIA